MLQVRKSGESWKRCEYVYLRGFVLTARVAYSNALRDLERGPVKILDREFQLVPDAPEDVEGLL